MMTTMRAGVVGATFVACSGGAGIDPPSASSPADTESSAIAKIVSRDRTVTLSAGHGTVRVSALDANGQLILHDVDIDQLHAIDATADQLVHEATSGNGASDIGRGVGDPTLR